MNPKTVKYLLLSFMLLSFFSCSAQKSEDVTFEKEVVIYNPINALTEYITKDSIYFIGKDLASRKEIVVYDLKGEPRKTIKIKKMPHLEYSNILHFINYDSMFISIASPLQVIYLIDSSSNIKFYKEFPYHLTSDSINTCLVNRIHYHNGNLYTLLNMYPDDMGPCSARIMLNRVARELPLYCKIPIKDSSELEFYGQNTVQYLYDNDSVFYGREKISTQYANGYLFSRRYPSVDVIIFDLNTNKIVKTLKISSKLIDTTPPKEILLECDDYSNFIDSINDVNQKGISITNICYDTTRELYYFFIEKWRRNNKTDIVVQIFDKDFNFNREFDIKNRKKGKKNMIFDDIFLFKNQIVLKYIENPIPEKTRINVIYDFYNINF